MTDPLSPAPDKLDIHRFFALAFAITWLFDTPWVLACLRNEAPPPYALSLTGLGAFGPAIAAIIVAASRRQARSLFARRRPSPVWLLVGLALPFPLHIAANLLEIALGGHPQQWFYPPVEPERIAAAVVFPLGEELGWRGFAYPRLADRHGPVIGSLILGLLWGAWHLGMMFLPGKSPDPVMVLAMMAELSVWSVVWAWVFERGHRSMAVALALHVGAHLDNVNRAPETEVRLRALRFAVAVVAALLAARALRPQKA